MRVALISDLHANELALKAVLSDIERVGVDQIVCLGDVATLGPRPRQVIDMVGSLGCPCIMGNHDEFLLDPEMIRAYRTVPIVVDAVDWCRAQLSAAELGYFGSFKRHLEIPLDGRSTLFLFHGSPRSHMEDLLATTPPDVLDEALAGYSGTVMAGGHTHLQMIRQHRGMYLLNPGSVGLPFKEFVGGRAPTIMSHAEYATVEGLRGSVNVTLRRVPLERRALREAVSAIDFPLRQSQLAQYAD